MIEPSLVKQKFEEYFFSLGEHEVYFSPGRVNLIGEHIDYNGGDVLPIAIDRGITAVFEPSENTILEIYNALTDDFASVDLQNLIWTDTELPWMQYVVGALKIVSAKQHSLRGGKLVMHSDLPVASGLSSSASLTCLILMLSAPDYYDENRLELALDAQLVETQEIGLACGIMDQYAIAFGKKNQAMLINTQDLTHEYAGFDLKNYELVVMNSNHPRSLVDSVYNDRKNECDQALRIVQNFEPVEFLARSHEISIAHIEDDTLYYRAKHVITEQQRVLAAYDALKLGRIDYLGDLFWVSHTSLDEDYEVAGDALNCLVYFAHKFNKCIGARMTGAGFGGCAIALVEKSSVERFITYVGLKYEHHQARKADFFVVKASEGIHRVF